MSELFDDDEEALPDPPRRRGRWLIGAIVAVVVLIFLISAFASIYTDGLWYHEVHYGSVFATMMWTKVGLFLVFGGLMAAVVGIDMWLAYRMRPLYRMGGDASVDRYRDAVTPIRGWLLAGVCVVVGGFAGTSAAGEWRNYLMWRNAQPFHQKDHYFGKDIGFYVFSLPWWHFVIDFVMATAVVALVATAVVHYLYGGIRLQLPTDRISGAAQVQISALLGVFMLARGVAYFLDRYDLVTSDHALFDGMNYTGENALLPARNILMGVALICALLFFLNIWRRTWQLPTVGLALLVLSAILIGMIWPAIVQGFQVKPSEADKEAPYQKVNIDATRLAYGLDSVNTAVSSGAPTRGTSTTTDIPGKGSTGTKGSSQGRAKGTGDHDGKGGKGGKSADTGKTGQAGQTGQTGQTSQTSQTSQSDEADLLAAVAKVPVVDPKQVSDTFDQLQQPAQYYSVSPILDVDHYDIAGQQEPLVLGVRELDQAGIPPGDRTWSNLHTVYTHGQGVIAAYGNEVAPASNASTTGRLKWLNTAADEGGTSTGNDLGIVQDQIYYGQDSPDYSIVGKASPSAPDLELGLGAGGGDSRTTYHGSGGVPIGGTFNRLMYAIKFGEPNFLLSGRVNRNSRVLYDRDPAQRVEKVAPWLTVDSDPYPAVVDGHVEWIVDGYTTTDRYPDSQSDSFQTMTDDSLQASDGASTVPTDRIDYMRSAVKATVDAYDGTVTLYQWDQDDPILKTWMKAFPGTVQPNSAIPPELKEHLRYPEDLFKVQRYQLAKYHVDNAKEFLQGSDEWQVPPDPNSASNIMQPPYRMFIDHDGHQQWSLTSDFVPVGKSSLAAYLSVDSDATSPDFGQLQLERMSNASVPGPDQVDNALPENAKVEPLLTRLKNSSTPPVYGNLITVPLDGSFLYVQPIYTLRGGNASSFRILKFVAVSYRGQYGIGGDLRQALSDALEGSPAGGGGSGQPGAGGQPGGSTGGGSSKGQGSGNGGAGATTGDLDRRIDAALTRAQQAFTAARAAQKDGNTVEWAREIKKAQQAVAQAAELSAQRDHG